MIVEQQDGSKLNDQHLSSLYGNNHVRLFFTAFIDHSR